MSVNFHDLSSFYPHKGFIVLHYLNQRSLRQLFCNFGLVNWTCFAFIWHFFNFSFPSHDFCLRIRLKHILWKAGLCYRSPANKTMVCYKEKLTSQPSHPPDVWEWTTWALLYVMVFCGNLSWVRNRNSRVLAWHRLCNPWRQMTVFPPRITLAVGHLRTYLSNSHSHALYPTTSPQRKGSKVTINGIHSCSVQTQT